MSEIVAFHVVNKVVREGKDKEANTFYALSDNLDPYPYGVLLYCFDVYTNKIRQEYDPYHKVEACSPRFLAWPMRMPGTVPLKKYLPGAPDNIHVLPKKNVKFEGVRVVGNRCHPKTQIDTIVCQPALKGGSSLKECVERCRPPSARILKIDEIPDQDKVKKEKKAPKDEGDNEKKQRRTYMWIAIGGGVLLVLLLLLSFV